MSAPDAMSESLNYPSMKRRAVASRSYRVKVSPSNGQNFTAGQTVNIDLPGHVLRRSTKPRLMSLTT